MKFLLILLLALPCYSQLKVNYDKFKDETIASAESVRVGGINLTVKVFHKGERAEGIQYYLVFHSVSREWKFLRSHDLIFLADGERVSLGRGSHDGKINTDRWGGVTETMIYRVEREDLEQFIKSASLEMKLGYLEAKLGEKDKKGMRDVLEYK